MTAYTALTHLEQTWARTLNHRPRADRGGRSRVELYREPITAEQIDRVRISYAKGTALPLVEHQTVQREG